MKPAQTISVVWQESLRNQIESLAHMLDNLDEAQVGKALNLIGDCRGMIIFTGIGQNLIMSAKLAATYNSLSLRAMSLDPVSSLHGGMSFLRPEDLLVPISKSGETAELLSFLQLATEQADCPVLAIHAAPGCSLERRSAHWVCRPLTQ